uniref:Uncharacterized protein n=1 Tax=Rhizophora mucronata TaxID=61149 RepID=A0A2P2QNV5_RHIMU
MSLDARTVSQLKVNSLRSTFANFFFEEIDTATMRKTGVFAYHFITYYTSLTIHKIPHQPKPNIQFGSKHPHS